MSNKILFTIVGVIAGLVVGFAITRTSPSELQSGMMGGGRSASSQMMGNIDRHFIEQMIPHHDGAIAMATLALTKATHPEIKNLAGAIIDAQKKEIEDMKAWYKSWFDVETPQSSLSMMGGGTMSGSGMHMGGVEDIEGLENATDFDKAFIEAMIPHHQLAVMMAQMLKSGTNRPEMLSLADNIIESQSKEIQEMQSWYKSWYQ